MLFSNYLAFGEFFLIFWISANDSNAITSMPQLDAYLRWEATLTELPKMISLAGIPILESCSISSLFAQLNLAPSSAKVLRTIVLVLQPASRKKNVFKVYYFLFVFSFNQKLSYNMVFRIVVKMARLKLGLKTSKIYWTKVCHGVWPCLG